MGEFGKEIAVKGVVAIVAVLFLASLAFYSPLGTNTTSLLTSSLVESGRTVTSITTSTYTQTHTNVVPGPLVTTTVTVSGTMTSNNTGDLAALLLGIVYSQNVTCSLSSGTCTMTMVNEGKTSGYDVVAVGCQQLIISSKNSTTTVWSIIQGEDTRRPNRCQSRRYVLYSNVRTLASDCRI